MNCIKWAPLPFGFWLGSASEWYWQEMDVGGKSDWGIYPPVPSLLGHSLTVPSKSTVSILGPFLQLQLLLCLSNHCLPCPPRCPNGNLLLCVNSLFMNLCSNNPIWVGCSLLGPITIHQYTNWPITNYTWRMIRKQCPWATWWPLAWATGGWECDGKERAWIQFEHAEFDVSMGNYGKMPGRAGNVSLTFKREVRAGFWSEEILSRMIVEALGTDGLSEKRRMRKRLMTKFLQCWGVRGRWVREIPV